MIDVHQHVVPVGSLKRPWEQWAPPGVSGLRREEIYHDDGSVDPARYVAHLDEQGIDIARELYVSVVLDRATGRNVVMASTEGGMEIEEVAANTPEKILRETVDPAASLADFQARRLAYALGLEGDAFKNGVRFLKALASAAEALDTDMLEINPLVVGKQGSVMALDGKITIYDKGFDEHTTSYGEYITRSGDI